MSNSERFAILTICEYKNGKPIICDQQVLDLPKLKEWVNNALAGIDAAAGQTATPKPAQTSKKHYKAREEEVIRAMGLLQKRAENASFDDWKKSAIVKYLSVNGIKLEISKKTKIGKYWAVIYNHKKRTPPPRWDKDDVKKARRDLKRDHIDFDWFL